MALISKLFIRFIIRIIVRFIICLTMRVTSLSLSDSSDELGSKSSPISFSISVDFIPYLHSSKIVWGLCFLFTLTIKSSINNGKHLYKVFSFGTFLLWKFLPYLYMSLFLSSCIFHYHHKQFHYQTFYQLSHYIFPIFYFLNSLLSITLKNIVSLLSKCLT